MNKRVYLALRKKATAEGDAIRGIPGSLLLGSLTGGPWLPAGARLGGSVVGRFQEAADPAAAAKELMEMDKGKEAPLSWVPGYNSYKVSKRKALINQLLQDKGNTEHNNVSRAVYDYVKWLNPLNIVAGIPAALTAAATDKRTLKEQKETADDKYYGLKSMLIPGWNTYNHFKSIGAADRLASATELERLTPEDLSMLPEEAKAAILAELEQRKKSKQADNQDTDSEQQ